MCKNNSNMHITLHNARCIKCAMWTTYCTLSGNPRQIKALQSLPVLLVF